MFHEDSARHPITGNQAKGKDRIGNLRSNDDEDFNEDFGSRARKEKLAELQRNRDRGLGVNQNDDFDEDETARRRRKEAEKARRDGGLGVNRNDDFEEDEVARRKRKEAQKQQRARRDGGLGVNRGDDFEEDDGGRRKKQQIAEQRAKNDGGLGINRNNDFEEDEGGRRRNKETEKAAAEKARNPGRLTSNDPGDFTEDFGGRRTNDRNDPQPITGIKKYQNEQFIRDAEQFEEQNMSPQRRGKGLIGSMIQPKVGGHLSSSQNDDFQEQELGMRKRRSNNDDLKSNIVKKSFMKANQEEKEEFDQAIRDLKRTASREKGLRSNLNPRGQYVKEEDSEFEESQISRRDRKEGMQQRNKSRIGLKSTLVIERNNNGDDIEENFEI